MKEIEEWYFKNDDTNCPENYALCGTNTPICTNVATSITSNSQSTITAS